MNNPDERTAVDQFGKDDKYFGVCTMLVTMPGLPMFGHGQIEGFAEKYGMEYYRAYWDETPDEWLIARHEREIFPLLHRRYLFAGTDSFLLYDFYMPDGHVNEDVFAYSNRHGDERSLVIYHNRYSRTSGWVRLSAAFMARTGKGDERALVQRTLAEVWRSAPATTTTRSSATIAAAWSTSATVVIWRNADCTWNSVPTIVTCSSTSARSPSVPMDATDRSPPTSAGAGCRASTLRCAKCSSSRC